MADALPLRKEMTFDYGVPREVAPGVRRIVAQNPSAFTYYGTNTYLVGSEDVAVIDPGPDDEAHLQAIVEAGAGSITKILLTHTHRDHCDGLAKLKAATGAKTLGFGTAPTPRGTTSSSPTNCEFVDHEFTPDLALRDGMKVVSNAWQLTAHHTPGHAPDHLCFTLEGTGILFSGDHVMGWNTSVIAPPEGNMGDYLRSLEKLLKLDAEQYLPGHGGAVHRPQRVAKAFLVHRKMREATILDCVKSGKSTVAEILEIVYRDVDDAVLRAAALSVFAHLELLIERGLVRANGTPSLISSFWSA